MANLAVALTTLSRDLTDQKELKKHLIAIAQRVSWLHFTQNEINLLKKFRESEIGFGLTYDNLNLSISHMYNKLLNLEDDINKQNATSSKLKLIFEFCFFLANCQEIEDPSLDAIDTDSETPEPELLHSTPSIYEKVDAYFNSFRTHDLRQDQLFNYLFLAFCIDRRAHAHKHTVLSKFLDISSKDKNTGEVFILSKLCESYKNGWLSNIKNAEKLGLSNLNLMIDIARTLPSEQLPASYFNAINQHSESLLFQYYRPQINSRHNAKLFNDQRLAPFIDKKLRESGFILKHSILNQNEFRKSGLISELKRNIENLSKKDTEHNQNRLIKTLFLIVDTENPLFPNSSRKNLINFVKNIGPSLKIMRRKIIHHNVANGQKLWASKISNFYTQKFYLLRERTNRALKAFKYGTANARMLNTVVEHITNDAMQLRASIKASLFVLNNRGNRSYWSARSQLNNILNRINPEDLLVPVNKKLKPRLISNIRIMPIDNNHEKIKDNTHTFKKNLYSKFNSKLKLKRQYIKKNVKHPNRYNEVDQDNCRVSSYNGKEYSTFIGDKRKIDSVAIFANLLPPKYRSANQFYQYYCHREAGKSHQKAKTLAFKRQVLPNLNFLKQTPTDLADDAYQKYLKQNYKFVTYNKRTYFIPLNNYFKRAADIVENRRHNLTKVNEKNEIETPTITLRDPIDGSLANTTLTKAILIYCELCGYSYENYSSFKLSHERTKSYAEAIANTPSLSRILNKIMTDHDAIMNRKYEVNIEAQNAAPYYKG